MEKIALIAFAIGFSAFAPQAHATCLKSGYIERVSNFASSTVGESNTVIYLRTASETDFRLFATTKDPSIAAAANSNVGGTRVDMRGDAATCPTTGKQRAMGTVEVLWINP